MRCFSRLRIFLILLTNGSVPFQPKRLLALLPIYFSSLGLSAEIASLAVGLLPRLGGIFCFDLPSKHSDFSSVSFMPVHLFSDACIEFACKKMRIVKSLEIGLPISTFDLFDR